MPLGACNNCGSENLGPRDLGPESPPEWQDPFDVRTGEIRPSLLGDQLCEAWGETRDEEESGAPYGELKALYDALQFVRRTAR